MASRMTRGAETLIGALFLVASVAAASDQGAPSEGQAPQLVWFTFATDTGCLYHKAELPEVHEEQKVSSATWKGDACEPGRAITGDGTLEESIDDVANRDEWTTRVTGRMVAGVFEGKVQFWSSVIDPRTETVEMVGGCEVANTLCHPRQPDEN
jgi:hypothetical protein